MDDDDYAAACEAAWENGAQFARNEINDLLADVSNFLDNYVDVDDGDYGEPRPNRAMRLKQRVDDLLDRSYSP